MPPLAATSTVWVGFSGGCDSHVLLHLLSRLRQSQPFDLRAVYVNHGLSPKAAEWGEHCHAVCDALRVDFYYQQVDATPKAGESPEAAARHARYAAFTEMLQPGDYLCTAHHQDDQAETLLLQLLRGAGPKGLAGMPASSPLGKATQLRPLLGFSQAQLLEYAQQHKLNWIEDESNSDTGFNRNYLRHDVMPALRQRWPSADATIARSAANCAEAAQLLEVLASQDYQSVKSESSTELDVHKLLELDFARQKNLLRYWVRQAGMSLPSEIKLQHIISDVLHAAADKSPCVKWLGAEVRRFDGRVYLMEPMLDFDRAELLEWHDLDHPLQLPNEVMLVCQQSKKLPALSLKKLRTAKLEIRFRHGGEQIRLPGKQHHVELKKLFQQQGIPPWQRQRIPLLFANGELVHVAGICIAEGFNADLLNDAVVIKQIQTS